MKHTTTTKGALPAARTYTATEARNNFADLFDAAHFGERVLVKKRDRCVAIVSLDLLMLAEKALQAEAAAEAEAAEAALLEFQAKGGKSLDQIEQELDMT